MGNTDSSITIQGVDNLSTSCCIMASSITEMINYITNHIFLFSNQLSLLLSKINVKNTKQPISFLLINKNTPKLEFFSKVCEITPQ